MGTGARTAHNAHTNNGSDHLVAELMLLLKRLLFACIKQKFNFFFFRRFHEEKNQKKKNWRKKKTTKGIHDMFVDFSSLFHLWTPAKLIIRHRMTRSATLNWRLFAQLKLRIISELVHFHVDFWHKFSNTRRCCIDADHTILYINQWICSRF